MSTFPSTHNSLLSVGWSPRQALRSHPLVAFFALAYCFSWLADILLYDLLRLPASLATSVYTMGPSIAALVVTLATGRRPRIGALVRWRMGVRWYALALLGVPFAYVLATVILPGAIAAFAPVSPARFAVQYVVVLFLVAVLGGPVFEEPGWRGFALPRLQDRLGALRGTLALGSLWIVWHLPQYVLVPEWAAQNGGLTLASVSIYAATVMAIAIIMTWLWNCSRGSLLLAILFHASINTAQIAAVNELFPALASTELNALLAFGSAAVALLLLTRGRLGLPATTDRTGARAD